MRTNKLNQAGVAILMVLVTISILTIIVVELAYLTHIETRMTVNHGDELKAFYFAKASANFSLLRIKIFNTVKEKYEKMLPADKRTLIWKQPIPLKACLQETQMNGDMLSVISSEDAKINVNNLGIKKLQETLSKQLLALLDSKMTQDEEFAINNFKDVKPKELIYNIADWVSPDPNRLFDEGDKNALYQKMDPPYKPRSAPMISLEELHLVEGMTDDIYDFLIPSLTAYSKGGININEATPEILKTIIQGQLTDEDMAKLIEKRNKTPFKAKEEFITYLRENVRSINIEEINKLDIVTDDSTFTIESTGISGNVKKTILMAVAPKAPPPPAKKESSPAPIDIPEITEIPSAQGTTPESSTQAKSTLQVVYWRVD